MWYSNKCYHKMCLFLLVLVMHNIQITPKDKMTIKGTTQVNEQSLKLHFFMFERSQGKHNSLNCHNFLGIFFINCKVYMLKVWHKSKKFLYIQNIQTSRVDNPCFFQTSFFLPNVHHSFWELKRILTLIIRRAKKIESMTIVFITHLSTFGSKVLLTLKIMDFENVALTKIVHIYVIKGMNA